jgi:hypothetical protein
VLDEFAVANPDDVDDVDRDHVPGRRQAHKLAGVGAVECLAGHHLVAVGEHVVHLGMQVRDRARNAAK